MMSVKNIVLLAAELVGVKEAVQEYLDGGNSAQGQRAVDGLLGCYLHVETELAMDYFPVLCEERVTAENGEIRYESLGRRVARVLALLDKDGNEPTKKIIPASLCVKSGTYTLRYAALPREKAIGDEAECGVGVSEQLMAYGIAAEYCLLKGLYEEHAAWEKKYKHAVASTYRLRGGKRMKAREWV